MATQTTLEFISSLRHTECAAGCRCWVALVVSDSVRPHKRQSTRLPCPWDSPGKDTGVGCQFLLQCRKVKSLSRVQLLETPQAPPSVGIFQARVLEWADIAFSNTESRTTQKVIQKQGEWLLHIRWRRKCLHIYLKSLGKDETHSGHKPHPWQITRQSGGNSQLHQEGKKDWTPHLREK